MRRLMLLTVMLVTSFPALAQHQTLSCVECRDVREHPKDFGNYAFNKLIEPLDNNFSIFTTYSTSTYVWNRNQQYALVMLDDVLEETGASAFVGGFSFPIRFSSEYVRITVQDQYGDTTQYQVAETSRPLVVGDSDVAPPAPPPPSSTTTSTFSGSKGSTSGTEILCCQEGTYYWYYDQPAFSRQFGNE